MDTMEFAESIALFKELVYAFDKDTNRGEQKEALAYVDQLLKHAKVVKHGQFSAREVAEGTRKAYAIAMRDGGGMNAADWFFRENCDELDGDEVEALNSLRRAKLSLFRIDERKGSDFAITDTKTAAKYAFRVIDAPEMPDSGYFFACIIPSQDGVWQSTGGMFYFGNNDLLEKQVGFAKKKQEMQLEMGSEFKEYFGTRLKLFAKRKECEDRLNEFITWRDRKLEAEDPAAENWNGLPKMTVPAEVSEPVPAIETYEGTVFGGAFDDFVKLASGEGGKTMRRNMIIDAFQDQSYFSDSIFRILYEEREDELIALAKEAYPETGDAAGLRKLVLRMRPALFDATMPRIKLGGKGGSVEDMWGESAFGSEEPGIGEMEEGKAGEGGGKGPGMAADGRGTGHPEINDSNREEFYTILQPIEAAIARCYRSDPKLKDKHVIAALKSLRDTYGHGVEIEDPVGREMFAAIRNAVEITGQFDSKDVRLCIRHVLKSAKLHHEVDGPRGYLDFITGYV